MSAPVKDDARGKRAPPDAEREDRAKERGGNPDKPPSANAGNVGLGAADENEAPRKPGSEI